MDQVPKLVSFLFHQTALTVVQNSYKVEINNPIHFFSTNFKSDNSSKSNSELIGFLFFISQCLILALYHILELRRSYITY